MQQSISLKSEQGEHLEILELYVECRRLHVHPGRGLRPVHINRRTLMWLPSTRDPGHRVLSRTSQTCRSKVILHSCIHHNFYFFTLPLFTTMRMLALTVLSFLIGSGPLLEGCTAFFVHHHQLQTHHQHPKIRRQPAAAAAATVVAVGYSLSTCSTTRMCYSDSIAPHGRSLSTGKFGAQALPRPPSSSSPSRVPAVALSAVRENRSGDGPPGDGINEAKEELLSRQAKLLISIMIDIIGMSSYVLPGMGEVCKDVVLRRLVECHTFLLSCGMCVASPKYGVIHRDLATHLIGTFWLLYGTCTVRCMLYLVYDAPTPHVQAILQASSG